MAFELPKDLSALSIEELAALRVEAIDEARAIDESGDDVDVDRLEVLLDGVAAIDDRITVVNTEAAEAESRRTAARERLAAASEPAVEPGDEGDPEDGDPAAEVVDPPAAVDQREAVVAGGQRRSTAGAASRRSPRAQTPKHVEDEGYNGATPVITAAADVPDFGHSQVLDGMRQTADAFISRAQTFGIKNPEAGVLTKGSISEFSTDHIRKGVARIKDKTPKFAITPGMTAEEQYDVFKAATSEKALEGGSLVAAGGWCKPSENILTLFGLESNAGLFDIAEIAAESGGINHTKGPDFSSVFADGNASFFMTEAQAEAGTFTKPFLEVDCPPFEEVRLDAIGMGLIAPILTNSAWPELIRRTLDLQGIAYARRKSARTLGILSTMIGATTNWTEVGGTKSSAISDVLDALELNALRVRQMYAMDPAASIDGVAPFWLRSVLRSDMSRRNNGGIENLAVTDAQIDSWLNVRGIRLQYVYDYQMLSDAVATTAGGTVGWTAFPTDVEVMMWPAGAYVRLTKNVINLDTVYDKDLLSKNEFVASFMEEGFGVANMVGSGVKVSISLRNYGHTGAPAITIPA